ncbi:hypothetical protein Q9L58_010321 [Maublancomyces gigas]|uniref:Nephrocystin 3-like N-terminal domain-containing protein n=1 Tax=Discina gigas TaxID=1032678 RepID=A0ABR3G4H5_9PEZI
MEVVLIGVEVIVRLLLNRIIYDQLYFNSTPALAVCPNLEALLEELFAAIRGFLAFAKRYLVKSSSRTVFDWLFEVEGKLRFDLVINQHSDLARDVALAEAETKNKDLRAILGAMEMPISWIDLNVQLIKVLEWISKIEYEKHHLQANEKMLERTGQWLLKKDEFHEWRCSSVSSIIWLHGISGAGKTNLTCMVINVLSTDEGTKGPVVYFYCNRNHEERQDPTMIIQALVRQLCVAVPGTPAAVVAEYDKRVNRGLGTLEFQECIDFVVTLMDMHPQTTIVPDALDESNPNKRWKLIEALTAIICSSATLVKIFISSRDDVDIKLHLEIVPNIYIDLRDNSADIARFVPRQVTLSIEKSMFFRGNVMDKFKEEIITTIEGKANGMFQWANLQIKNLARLKLVDDIQKDLAKLPATLDDSYSQIWAEILSESPHVRGIATKGLMWVMCGRGTFNQETWAEASYYPGSVPKSGVHTLLDFCRNLVVWNEPLHRMIFAHLSVQEYLETKVFNSVDANIMAVKSCLRLVGHQQPEIDHLQRLPFSHALTPRTPFALYSIINWPYHVELCYAGSMGEEILGILQGFLGTFTQPSEEYARWLAVAGLVPGEAWGSHKSRMPLSLLGHLTSQSPNPSFLICYFRFGEALHEMLKRNGLHCNEQNLAGGTLLSVASMQGNEPVMDILLGSGTEVSITPSTYTGAVIAANKCGHAGAVVKLLDWGASQVAFGIGFENILEIGARFGNAATVKAMMQWGCNVTHPVQTAVVTDYSTATEFLPVRDDQLKMTAAVLIAAASNQANTTEVVKLLLAGEATIEITTAVLAAAVNNRNATEVIKLLLAREATVEITAAVLAAAAKNRNATEVIQALLARATTIEITEAVLVAAAVNDGNATEVIKLLLARDATIKIREAVVVAAENHRNATEVIDAQPATDATIEITEAILVAVVNNRNATEVIKVLLARATTFEITEAVLVAAAEHWNAAEVINVLLAIDTNITITEAILLAAVNSRGAEVRRARCRRMCNRKD